MCCFELNLYKRFDPQINVDIIEILQMDSKKSPLALLAQTCSQIGADPPIPASRNEPKKKTDKSASSPASVRSDSKSPAAKAHSDNRRDSEVKKSDSRLTPVAPEERRSVKSSSPKTAHEAVPESVKSGADLFKESQWSAYKSLLSAYHPAASYPPPFSPYADPQFYAAFGLGGAMKTPMPPPPMGFPMSGYAGLPPAAPQFHPQRAKTGADCRDPFCTTCPPSTPPCAVPGCAGGVQCEHSKVSAAPRPYVCNWIAADQYCGKKFATSDELLQHLRTHTNLSTSEASGAPTTQPAPAHPLLHRNYPTPPLSPLSAARYHPYAKQSAPNLNPAAFPAGFLGLSAAPAAYSALFPHPALAPYYSHLSHLYGPRLGGAPTATLPP